MSSLEKEVRSQEASRVRAETQLTETLGKYEAAPRQEVVERYKEEVEKLTQEVGGVKETLKE